ncbi:putative periplasmic serine endoprotease DegP-like protein [Bryobacterales bacterium F-183]|nr:putative periplasmic serine endoprotease DegP-like protein [Bryobacterales bacterium F-183]
MSLLDKIKQQKLLSFTVLLFTLATGILIGTLIDQSVSADTKTAVAPDATPLVVPPVAQIGNDFTRLAKKLEPSVVYITAETGSTRESASNNRNRQGQRTRPRPSEEDEEDEQGNLFDFFRGGPFGQQMPRAPRRASQSGTGFIVDKNGYIITNNHVVEKMDKINVVIHGDPVRHKAKLIGSDSETDIAVLKIDAKNLTPVVIGNSDGVQVGDWSVAIGSPFGLEASVTAGIISALGRDLDGAQAFQSFLQTDAAINPGNSGGPLLNVRGEVIGVNTMIATRSGGYEGIGFALPSNMAVKVYNQIIQNGRVTRGYIGITWNRRQKAETLRAMGVDSGVFVEDVSKDGPADKAGIKPNDIIVLLNGKPVKDGNDLVNRVADLPVGTVASVTVDRDGKRMDHKLTIGDREKGMAALTGAQADQFKEEPVSPEGTPAKFGISIRDLSAEEKEGLNTPDKKGIRVARVEEDSFAEEIGLQENDVIVWINRVPTGSLEDVRKVQAKLKPGDAVAFGVMRPLPAGMARGRAQYTRLTLSGTLSKQ